VITALRIRNFKCLADTGKLPMRPVTFLVGPNSSGKTTIIQSLLLLRQTVESRDLKNPLSINGPYVQLGSYPDLLFMHDKKARLHLEIEFPPSLYRGLPAGLREGNQFDFYELVNFDVEFGYNKKTMQVFLQRCDFRLLPQGYDQEISRVPGGKYQVQLRRDPGLFSDPEAKPISVSGVEKFYAVRGLSLTVKLPSRAMQFRRGVAFLANQLAREMEELFRDVFYIGPLREWPRRIYIATGEAPQDVGLKGELSVDVLWVQARRKATRERLLGKVNHWMREFGLATEVKLKRVGGNNYSVIFQDPNSGLDVNLADVGFGASQIFPIVVEGFYARDRAMLLIEQPEIHLHPKAQAKLGDLLLDIASSGGGKTLLVETHSEHVLSRIRRRIAEKTVSPESVAIYYCEPTPNGTRIREIRVNERGQYEGEGIPSDFFEESYEEAVEHFKALAEPARR
jgi:predicted ATPase